MTGKHYATAGASGAGEIEDYLQDTVKYIGGVATKLWTAGTGKAKELLSEGDGEGMIAKSEAEEEEEDDLGPIIKSFEDFDMLVSDSPLHYPFGFDDLKQSYPSLTNHHTGEWLC